MKWKRLFFLIIGTVCIGHADGQSITAYGGVNYGGFFSNRKSEGHFKKEFDRGFGFLAGVEISELKVDSIWNFAIGIGIEQYGGSFYARDGGLGGSNHVEGELKKQSLYLSVSPINIQLFKHAFIRPGLCLNYELHKNLIGEYYSWDMSMPQAITDDLSAKNHFTKPLNGGIHLLFGYSFNFNKFSIEPRYSFFLGLSREMNNAQAIVKSFRHGLSIGINF